MIYQTVTIKPNFETINKNEMFYNSTFCMNIFATPSLKNITATLCTIKVEKSELTFS